MKLLPECIRRPEFDALRSYLRDDPNGIKCFQLAEKIADLFDQYLVFRPEMILEWDSGKQNHWQAYLWRMLATGKEKYHRAYLRQTLLHAIENQSLQVSDLPTRLSMFGISYLPPFHMQVFVALSFLIPVNLFLMNPCRQYWADIVSDRETKRIKKHYPPSAGADKSNLHLERGNPLLASMGILGRDFFYQVSSIDCDVVEQFESPGSHDILHCVQSDILSLTDRQPSTIEHFFPEEDGSIQIHSCHSPMREIEVLYDNLLAIFEADSELLPKDVIVMTPDIDAYAPYIQAVFDSQATPALRIPFTIADRSVNKESRLIDDFLALLNLKDGRIGATQVVALLERQTISEKFNLKSTDIELVEHWISETNIRWGVDAQDRQKYGIPSFKENTWMSGIERLLLGYVMPEQGDQLFSEIFPYDQIEGSDGLILGRFLDFMERVFNLLNTIQTERNLDGWHRFFNRLLDDFFITDETTEPEMLMLRKIIDELRIKREQAEFNDTVGIDVIRTYLKHNLEKETFGYGFISGGVTFCAMLPMRSIPFKVICLIGMNTDGFPRENRSVGFDLISKYPKRGDRSRRNDDKYLFLEALVSARNQLYISYIGKSIQDNSLIPPSVLVSELIDYLKSGFGLTNDQLVRQHRLQAFSPDYFQGDEKLFSYSDENFRACASLVDSQPQKKTMAPFISTKLAMSPEEIEEWKHLDIKDLSAFFSNPARYLLQKRLGIYLEDELLPLDERENFELSPLEQYAIGQDLINKQTSGVDLEKFRQIQKAKGRLPHGTVGDVWYNQLSIEAESYFKHTSEYTKGKTPDHLDVNLNLAGFHIIGRIVNIYPEQMVFRVYAKLKPKYVLNTWCYHVLLNVLDKEKFPQKSLLICKDTIWEFTPLHQGRAIFTSLLEFYRQGLIMPVHFFPDSSFEYALQLLEKNKLQHHALQAAKKKWNGSDFQRGESEDPYFQLCFGKMDSSEIFDQNFQQAAGLIFNPIMAHSSKFIFYQ